MRSVRSTIAVAAALALGGAVAASARAAEPTERPASHAGLYAPSALVLGIGKGTSAAESTVQRAVTLSCAPRAEGTHPSPADACGELRAVNGDFAALPSTQPQALCTREWDPVTVTADGVWRGERVVWSATYNNGCEREASLGGALFSF
ncbi:subtilase-type protease inhibitor [Streptomyces sp. NPDC001985]|uniref:subtilase-type protease inhibitor n=1 Tax=Streptomyces sp. NPDC001985 TaxID=3154406 RepID=UPI00331EC238